MLLLHQQFMRQIQENNEKEKRMVQEMFKKYTQQIQELNEQQVKTENEKTSTVHAANTEAV